jgi:hypothetical protein
MISLDQEFEEAQEVASMLIKGMGYQQALIYVTTYPTESLEEELIATMVQTAIIQQMSPVILN